MTTAVSSTPKVKKDAVQRMKNCSATLKDFELFLTAYYELFMRTSVRGIGKTEQLLNRIAARSNVRSPREVQEELDFTKEKNPFTFATLKESYSDILQFHETYKDSTWTHEGQTEVLQLYGIIEQKLAAAGQAS